MIKEAFQKVSDVSVDRLHDQTTGYLGSANIITSPYHASIGSSNSNNNGVTSVNELSPSPYNVALSII